MTASHTATIQEIRSLLDGYKADVEEFGKDLTLEIARKVLADAEAAKARADAEDDTIDAAELVDRRFEAARAVEIARVNLQRAERIANQRAVEVPAKFHKAQALLVAALRDAHGPLREALRAGAVRVYGSETYQQDQGFFGSIEYRLSERLMGTARRLEASSTTNPTQAIRDAEHALAILQDALRDR